MRPASRPFFVPFLPPLRLTRSTLAPARHRRVAHIHSALEFKDALHLGSLTAAISRLQTATAVLDAQKDAALRKLFKLTHPAKGRLPFPLPGKWAKIREVLDVIKGVNFKIARFEKGFLGEGLKDREWYKHVGTAPCVPLVLLSQLVGPPADARSSSSIAATVESGSATCVSFFPAPHDPQGPAC